MFFSLTTLLQSVSLFYSIDNSHILTTQRLNVYLKLVDMLKFYVSLQPAHFELIYAKFT